MLTRVDVQSENPFYLNIRDARPTDSIIVSKIEGLGPVDIDLFIGDFARDGGSYDGRRVPPRDLTFWLEYNPNYEAGESVSGLRRLLYKTFLDPFPRSKSVPLIFHDDEVADQQLVGYTTKFDGDIFSDETTAQIVMRCPQPYLVDVVETVKLSEGPTLPFQYAGTAETGFIVEAEITVNTSWLKLDLNDVIMIMDYDFQVGDEVYIDTRPGSKRVQVTRAAVTTDILYSLYTSTSEWLLIHSPDNVLKIYGATPESIVGNITRVAFNAYHWGV